MKNDTNPDIIFFSYGTPEKQQEFIDAVKKRGRGIREIRLFSVEQPLNSKYDEDINFYKHFILNEYWADRMPKLFDNMIVKMALNKIDYTPIKFKNNAWQNDNRHPLLLSLICPIAFQNQEKYCETPEEKKNIIKLKTFGSDFYEPKITGVHDK